MNLSTAVVQQLQGRPLSEILAEINLPKEDPRRPVASPETKEAVRSLLKVGSWIVEFTKVDGTQAIMECTLDPKLLPPSETDPTLIKPTRSEVPHLLHVYALDRQGWRSFVVANVTKLYKKAEVL